jgi:hypothetical protein
VSGVSLADAYERSEQMVGRRIVDEFVIVPIVSHGADVDSIFNLNAVAAFIWERLDGKATGETIVDGLVGRFEVERERAASDYRRFVEQLVTIGAVRRVAEG